MRRHNIPVLNKMQHRRGFTIVELLIVIVVIGILASIVIVAYNGIQNKATDTRRASDIASIQKALEHYFVINGQYPPSTGSTAINGFWTTTADASWAGFVTTMQPYANIPKDPVSTPNNVFGADGYNYSYYNASSAAACGGRIEYLLVYKLIGSPNGVVTQGATCPEGGLVNYAGLTTINYIGS